MWAYFISRPLYLPPFPARRLIDSSYTEKIRHDPQDNLNYQTSISALAESSDQIRQEDRELPDQVAA
jgi:hypothetical protein